MDDSVADFLSRYRLHFLYLQQSPRMKFFLTPRSKYYEKSVFFTLKYEYQGKNETKKKNNLTYCSVTKAGSNDEKTGPLGVENLIGLSL